MKKFLSLMMSLMLLVLPCVSLAENTLDLLKEQKALNVTITLADANFLPLVQDEKLATAINELLNAVGLRFTMQQADAESLQESFAVLLSGSNALTADILINTDGVYFASNFLGQDVMNISWQQALDTLEGMKDEMLAGGVSAEELEEVLDTLKQLYENPAAMFNAAGRKADWSDMDLTNTIAVMEKLMAKCLPADVSTAPEGCDAASAITVSVNGDELYELYSALLTDFQSTEYGKNAVMNWEKSMAMNDEAFTLDELLKMGTGMLKGDAVLTLYLNAEGKLVAIIENAAMLIEEGKDDTLDVVVLIVESEERTTFDCTVSNEDKVQVKVYGTVDVAKDDESDQVKVDVYVTVPTEETEEGVRVLVVSDTKADGTGTAQVKILPLTDEVPYLTVNMTAELVDMLPAVNTENPVQILTMSEEELEAWVETLSANAQLQLIKMLQLLPPSVLSIMMAQ